MGEQLSSIKTGEKILNYLQVKIIGGSPLKMVYSQSAEHRHDNAYTIQTSIGETTTDRASLQFTALQNVGYMA